MTRLLLVLTRVLVLVLVAVFVPRFVPLIVILPLIVRAAIPLVCRRIGSALLLRVAIHAALGRIAPCSATFATASPAPATTPPRAALTARSIELPPCDPLGALGGAGLARLTLGLGGVGSFAAARLLTMRVLAMAWFARRLITPRRIVTA